MIDVLRTPYRLGGRQVGEGLDCLGVVGEVARRRGLPPPDGWPSIARALREGRIHDATGLPEGWRRVDATPLQEGDVLVFGGDHPGCAIVHEGHVVSASPELGCYRRPVDSWERRPHEVWRWQP